MSDSHRRHTLVPAALLRLRAALQARALDSLRALAFWLAVCLPWGLLVFVFAGYTSQHPDLLAALLVSTVLCNVLGRGYPRG